MRLAEINAQVIINLLTYTKINATITRDMAIIERIDRGFITSIFLPYL
ncbi:MAG: hypothetical protein KAW47_10375 [Thermoplasmatales archaeon]|nr:hypothetical protein [Thermoplasmatales archaeon]